MTTGKEMRGCSEEYSGRVPSQAQSVARLAVVA
jgi:hypothetical protein